MSREAEEPITEHVRALTGAVLEVHSGARPAEQIARWVSEPVFATLKCVSDEQRETRRSRHLPIAVPAYRVGGIRIHQQTSASIEAVAIVHTRGRVQAMALRLEHIHGQWRIVLISLL